MNRRQAVPVLLYLVPALVLSRLPLFDVMGYEYATAIALLIPWISGFWTITLIGNRYRHEEPGSFLATLLDALRRNLLLLLLPFLVNTINIFLVRNCSYGEGALFFLLIPGVTMIYTVALAALCTVTVRRPKLLYICITLFTLAYPLWIGYRTPAIYSYNPIYGYFPGFSYDELITITTPLIVFRLLTLIGALWCIVMAMFFLRHAYPPVPLRERLKSIPSLAAIDEVSFGVLVGFVFLLLSWVFRAELGFESPAAFIQSSLSAVKASPHFRIHYVPGEFSDDEIATVALEHEFRFHQVADDLMVDEDVVIDSYIYPDAAAKRRFIGTGNTNIAKPWRKEIHINKDAWDAVLKHELVHVMAGEFGMPVIKAHYNIGLVEGLATAVEDDFGNRTLHQYAASMFRFNLVSDASGLISPAGFMTGSSQRSYILMGSFTKYLIGRYGMMRFKQLYGGSAPREVYGMTYGDLLDEWQDALSRIDVPEEWRGHVEYYFNRPSIFAKECARSIAKINERGWRLLDERQPKKAIDQFRRSLVASWNSEAFSGMVRAAYRAEKFDSVVAMMKEQRRDSSLSSNLLLYYGDALWTKNDTSGARAAYQTILKLDLSTAFNELLQTRLAALADSSLRRQIAGYFNGTMSDSLVHVTLLRLEQQHPNPILPYLSGRLYARRREYSAAVRTLEAMKPFASDSILNAGRETLLGDCYVRLKKYQRAKEHYWLSQNFIGNLSEMNAVDDDIARCDWAEDQR